jgi:hypothetical protein
MSVSKLTVLLASTACVVSPDNAPRTGEQTKRPLAAIAGDYYFGDGLGVNCTLAITPEGRFSFEWRGCLGVYDRNSGEARIADGHLILKPEWPNPRDGFRGSSTDLIPVRWGERSYLVPTQDAEDFCNEVNQGREPRDGPHGHSYLRTDDWKKQVAGLPSVPKQWEAMLLKKAAPGQGRRGSGRRPGEVRHRDR